MICPFCIPEEGAYVDGSCDVCGLTTGDLMRLNGNPTYVATGAASRCGSVDGCVYVGRGWWRNAVSCPVDLHIQVSDGLAVVAVWLHHGDRRTDIVALDNLYILLEDYMQVRLVLPALHAARKAGIVASIVLTKKGK